METCYTTADIIITMIVCGIVGIFFGVVGERIFGGRIHPNQMKR